MKVSECKKDIVLITNYYHFEEEKGSSRYRSLAEMIAEREELALEVVTSDFYHQTKKHRGTEISTEQLNFKVTFCHEDGYKKNISLQRLKSSRTFGKNVLKYLQSRKKPDLIYQVVPSLDVADMVSAYAEKNNIPLIIDVQDLWPEAFRMALDIPILSDILFAPLMKKANRIYGYADQIVAVSETYVKRALAVNKKCKTGLAVFLGSDMKYIEKVMAGIEVHKPKEEFWISYVGALGYSYDLETVIQAIAEAEQRGIKNIVFQVMGNGPLKEKFQKLAAEKNIKANFQGFVEYGKMMSTLSASEVAVNPIVAKSAASIINKVSDYAIAGMPVINTQNSPEYRALLETYECGINCENGNVESLSQAIETLYCDAELRAKMSTNAKILAKEKFNRQDTYYKIVEKIKEMAL